MFGIDAHGSAKKVRVALWLVLSAIGFFSTAAFGVRTTYASPAKTVVIVGVSDLEPLCRTGKEIEPGIMIRVLHEIAAQENWELRLISGSLSEIKQKLATAEIHLAAPTFFTQTVADRFEFSRESIISTWAQIYAPLNSSMQSLLNLAKLSIGVKRDDPYNLELRQTLAHLNLNCRFVEFNRYADILTAIEQGWVDAGVVDRLYGFMKEKDYRVKRTPIIFSPMEIRFAAPKGASRNYLNVIDYHLNRQKKDPASIYNRQIVKIFGDSDYGNIPQALKWSIIIIFGALMISLGFVFFLKQQVRLKTAELVEKNKALKNEVRLRSATEEKYRSVFENTGTATVIIEKDATVSMANQKAAEISGYQLSEFKEKLLVSQLISAKHRLRILKMFRCWEKRGGGVPLEFEFQLLAKNGRKKEVLARIGKIPGSGSCIASLIDITERKQKENEYIQLATAVEQSSESMAIIGRDRTVNYVNPAFEKMSGYRRKEVMGKNLEFLRSESHDMATVISMENAMAAGRVWRERLTNKRKDGTPYITETTISPIFDASGQIINHINIKRDITVETGLEAQLRQSQKLQAIGQLAGGIAHDFNNVLASIMGNTELALFTLQDDHPLRQRLHNTLAASERAKGLINQILMFSRKKDQVKKPIDFNAIVEEALKLISSSAPSTIVVRQKMATEPIVILADPTQVHQIVMNLCTNAINAMRGQNGTLNLSTKALVLNEDTAKQYLDLKPGAYAMLTVADNGGGMDAATRERIFEPFFTTKQNGKGTGMGLSVVHGIVKSHKGMILVESEPEKGSCFQVFFPKIEQAPIESKNDFIQVRETPRNGKILVVDDEKEVAEVCVAMLEQLGYDVTSTTSSKKALALFQSTPEAFDLVVTDQTMPGLTGIDLSMKMFATRPDLPIMLCTGYSDVVTEQSARKIGIGGFAMKPYRLENLAQIVGRLLKQEPDKATKSDVVEFNSREKRTASAI